MTLVSAIDVRAEWEVICNLSRRDIRRQLGNLWHEQPLVAAYVMAVARDVGTETMTLGSQLALAIDRLYSQALSRKPAQISESVLEQADDTVQQNAAALVGVAPELALRRMLHQREFAEPDIPLGLIQLLMEEDDEPEAGGVAGFIIAKTLALAYEFANGMQGERGKLASLADMVEKQTGRPAPDIRSQQPCPCGSGRAFQACHGDLAAQAIEEIALPAVERRFWSYMDVIGMTMDFFREIRSEPAAQTHWKAFDQFGEAFKVGDEGGVFDSMQLGYFLFDLPLGNMRQTVGERFLQEQGEQLTEAERVCLRHLIVSHLGFYEYVGAVVGGAKKLCDLVTGQSWLASGVDDPTGTHDEPGDIMIVRLVGPSDDALMAGMPVLLAPAAKALMRDIGTGLIEKARLKGSDLVENNRLAMKAAVPTVADFLVSTGLMESDEEGDGEDFDDDEDFDDEDFDDEDFDDDLDGDEDDDDDLEDEDDDE